MTSDFAIFFSDECKQEFCPSLCIKDELGEDDDKKGGWTRYFSRAPDNSDDCMTACTYGCNNMPKPDDD